MRRTLTLIPFLVMPACEAPPDSPPPLADGVGLGVETMVLEPSNDQWRIRHIHWSSR